LTDVLLMTNTRDDARLVLPALALLRQDFRVTCADTAAVPDLTRSSIVIVDGRSELPGARALCRQLRARDVDHVVLTVVTEGGLAGVNGDWEIDDVIVDTASPAEVDARLRLAQSRLSATGTAQPVSGIRHGAILIDPATRTVTLGSRKLTITYQEFQLLLHLAQHPGRVFTRTELLSQVWGHHYVGGCRTVDVHVRRLRSALGVEHADHIGTVRRVGYTFVPQPWRAAEPARAVAVEAAGLSSRRPHAPEEPTRLAARAG
jgi:DNA-binding response OmpR family regulator